MLIEMGYYIIMHLTRCLHGSGYPTSRKSVTHQQEEWPVSTLPVQAIHYII